MVPASSGNTARQALLISDLKPDGIGCTPSYLLNLIEFMQNEGKLNGARSLRYAILGAEPWSESKEGMPVIRYRTGDIAALYPEPCRCGRTTVRMSRVKGRIDDMLIIRGINVFPSEVEYQLLQVEELAPHYQLVATRHTALDRLHVLVEPLPEVARAWGGVREDDERVSQLRRKVAERLYGSLGIRVVVEVLPPGSLPRSEGKAVRIIDQRPKAG